jgi:hypothetical protein
MAQTLQTDVVKEMPAAAVLIREESPRHAGGRPLRLNVKKFLKICAWIQAGKSNTTACRAENIDYSTFWFHTRRKPRWRLRYEHANSMRDQFLCDVHLTNIVRHAEQNWAASAWILERKFPALFALHFKERSSDTTALPVGNEIPISRLQEYGKLMLELAQETAEKELAQTPNEPSEVVCE